MEVIRTVPAALAETSHDVTVVIDVFRATSTASVLLSRGVESLAIVARPEDLAELPEPTRGPYLVFSELERAGDYAERVDNSPVIASQIALTQKTPVLVTTNGTRAAHSAFSRSRHVLLASFLNVGAVARYLVGTQPSSVTIVPSGNVASGQPHIEDDKCADALQALLAGQAPDYPTLAEECLADARVKRRLESPGMPADVRLALTPDTCPVVIQVVRGETPGPDCVATPLSPA